MSVLSPPSTADRPRSYETLSDPELRHIYDVGGMEGLSRGAGMGGMDAADLFAQFFQASGGGMNFGFDFGPGGAGPSRRRGKGEDTMIPHTVTLDELYNGKTLKLNLEKEAVCGTCKGYILVCVSRRENNPRIDLVHAAAQSLRHVARAMEKGGQPHK
jgi:DnaJ-class molecular chaperone